MRPMHLEQQKRKMQDVRTQKTQKTDVVSVFAQKKNRKVDFAISKYLV